MIDLAHYFHPDHIQSTTLALITMSTALGALVALLARAKVSKNDAVQEVDKRNDAIRDETISLLTEQNELLRSQNDEFRGSVNFLTEKVMNLNSKVENLTTWFEAIGCLRAPFCPNRDCPDRFTFTEIVNGQLKPEDLQQEEK